MREFQFEAIGTHWKIQIKDTLRDEESATLLAQIHVRIDAFDRDYSRFRDDSLVTEMSKNPGVYTLPKDAKPMLDLYQELYTLTGGLMTPLIGQLLSDAGYDAEYSLQSKPLNAPPSWDAVLVYTFPKLEIKKPVLLDFGAAGKGYVVDIVAQLLKDVGVQSFSIDAGGDICVYGTEPVRIGLEHPKDVSQAIGVATIANKSICGSAGNRRAWGAFHHIMNPETLTSVQTIAAVWAVADTTLLADGLATALFFVSPQTLASRYSFQWLIMYEDSSEEHSKEFPAELFTTAQ